MKRTRRRELPVTAAIGSASMGTAAAAVSAAAVPKACSGTGGCFDPGEFGAVPDAGADDRAQLQAGIDTASAAGGGTLPARGFAPGSPRAHRPGPASLG